MKFKNQNTNRESIVSWNQNDEVVTDHRCFEILLSFVFFDFVFLISFPSTTISWSCVEQTLADQNCVMPWLWGHMFHQPIQFVHIFLLCDGQEGLRISRRSEINDRKEREILEEMVENKSKVVLSLEQMPLIFIIGT